jgi:hypothetical protein
MDEFKQTHQTPTMVPGVRKLWAPPTIRTLQIEDTMAALTGGPDGGGGTSRVPSYLSAGADAD